MDRLRKVRTPLRSSVTKTINEAEAELGQEEPNKQTLRNKLQKLEEVVPELLVADQNILDALLDADCTEEVYEAECLVIEEYKDKVRVIKCLINDVLHPVDTPGTVRSPSPSDYSTAASEIIKKRNYKLPTREMKKFNGELKGWLSFWSQFEQIHEDEELHDSDKFQYLVQSMVEGTRAQKLVESYPQTAENYPKVVEALKDRFGDKVLIAEVYVRDLIKMVINNAGKSVANDKLVNMYDDLETHLRALESIGVDVEQSAIFLYPLVESSLPLDTIKVWQRSPLSGYDDEGKDNPAHERLKNLMKFLKQETKGEHRLSYVKESVASSQKVKVAQGKSKKPTLQDEVPTVAGLHIGEKCCVFCEKSHDAEKCFRAPQMSIDEKTKILKEKKCCFICLRFGHLSKNCKAFVRCPIPVCQKRHVVVMCPTLEPSKEAEQMEFKKEISVVKNYLACSSQVVLGTLIVTVQGRHKSKQVRALIDSGSQRSYLLKSVTKDLELEAVGEEEIIHSLFSGVQMESKKHLKFQIKCRNLKGGSWACFAVLDQDKICGNIPRVAAGPWMKDLKKRKIWINDLGKGNEEIQLLLGANVLGKILTGQVVQLSNGLSAVETALGWTVMGEARQQENRNRDNLAVTVTDMFVSECSPQQLWDLESIGICDSSESMSKEEREKSTKEHFLQTVSRTSEGRYSVSLPWIDGVQKIPDNRQIAEKRLRSTTAKLHSMGMYKDYENIFVSWLEEGIIEEVPEEEVDVPCHYLPHRAVLKPDSSTTPIRPVYDASCKLGRSPSLNECLEKGPNILELIPSLLVRFREKNIGVVSDVRKAFQMIEVRREDRDFLRFLWWDDPVKHILKIYRHTRVVFGVNCSPFLLAAVIEYHLRAVEDDRKQIADRLLESLYVDNCVTSVDTVEEYQEFRHQATELMAEAKMDLRLWQSNLVGDSGVGPLIGRGCGLESEQVRAGDHSSLVISVLGLKWNLKSDQLSCDVSTLEIPEKITKRTVLSYVHRIFDPMGFLSPALLYPKRILQDVWADKCGWDEELNEERGHRFLKWHSELPHLKDILLPRNATGFQSDRRFWQIHTFCDASQEAYAAAVFLRTVVDGRVSVQLLQSKTRVAPLKKTTIPRLELLACTIGSRLAYSVKKALYALEVPCFYWSDSTTALAWIKRNDLWGTFVGNRVKEILKLTSSEEWKHVPGIVNPADLPSRGCTPSQLVMSRWWEGPEWLKNIQEEWPVEESEAHEEDVVQERRKVVSKTMLATEQKVSWFVPTSSFISNLRIFAWIKRFVLNARLKKENRIQGKLTVDELCSAERALMKLVQEECFVGKEPVMFGVHVKHDESGMILVKTKLLNRDDSPGFRFPVLLPSCHPLVEQLIRWEHIMNGHAGVQFLMGHLREKYWILQGRRTIKKLLKGCVTCLRFTAKKIEVIPAALPENRVRNSKVFEVIGVDLAGPLYLKDGSKVWIVLFTCAVYRCVHLELVTSLSTEDFLDALDRFIMRRGRPVTVYSDNGTNFVGAVNLFKHLDWRKIERETQVKRIQWRFNPPSAAWWGGFFERMIRSVKDLLKRMLGRARLTLMKMQTALCQAESIVNGRPLTCVTEDQEDLIPLTPAMFLQEIYDVEFPEGDYNESDLFRRKLGQQRGLREELKSRFRKEYLSLLVQRGKAKPCRELKVGDLVFVGADNKKRWEWPKARIVELLPGKDGNVRVARIKTENGMLLRPVQRLYHMEISSSTDPLPIAEDVKKKASRMRVGRDSGREVEPKMFTRFGREVKSVNRLNM